LLPWQEVGGMPVRNLPFRIGSGPDADLLVCDARVHDTHCMLVQVREF
jgi:hypothetical protein